MPEAFKLPCLKNYHCHGGEYSLTTTIFGEEALTLHCITQIALPGIYEYTTSGLAMTPTSYLFTLHVFTSSEHYLFGRLACYSTLFTDFRCCTLALIVHFWVDTSNVDPAGLLTINRRIIIPQISHACRWPLQAHSA